MVSHVVRTFTRYLPGAVFCQHTSSKTIALTIDDVGDADTLKILDAIDQFNQTLPNQDERIRATFFVITDDLDPSRTILKEILSRGHEIGNHGQKDPRHASLDPAEFAAEFKQAHQILTSIPGAIVRWFRPGQGFYNQQMLRVVQQMPGYDDRMALASHIPLDTRPPTNNPDFTVNYLSQFIFPGSIWVMHGGSNQRTINTVASLHHLLPNLQSKGYRLVTLTQQLWNQQTG